MELAILRGVVPRREPLAPGDARGMGPLPRPPEPDRTEVDCAIPAAEDPAPEPPPTVDRSPRVHDRQQSDVDGDAPPAGGEPHRPRAPVPIEADGQVNAAGLLRLKAEPEPPHFSLNRAEATTSLICAAMAASRSAHFGAK